jgi:heterodisulfide reductase subunit C
MNQELTASKVDENGFLKEVCSMPGGECVRWCIQCGMCSASCPNISEMDYSPRRVIALIRAGKRREILTSNSMWICASCYLCTVRCPKDVKPTELMHTLECLAVRHGLANGKVATPVMYRAFVDSIKSNGRVHEFGLMAKYYLKTNPFAALKMLPMALKLLTHGRMPLRGETVKGREQIKAMMDKANALGGAK